MNDAGFREDDDLAMRCREGDPAALATLYRRHAPPLLGYLTKLLGEPAEAEDVLQETFVRLFEGRGRYHGRGRFRAWLFTVATRLARDRQRQTRRRRDLDAAAIDELIHGSRSDPTERIRYQDLSRRIDAALLDLPPAYAATFHLRVRESFSYEEIADMAGEPEGTLRSRVHHALRRVRQALEGSGFERPPRDRKRETQR